LEVERQQLLSKIQHLEFEVHKGYAFELSSPDESHVTEFSVKVSELNDKYLNIHQMYEESAMSIVKLKNQLNKAKNEYQDSLRAKNKEIKDFEKKIADLTKRIENQDKKNKQIISLKSKISALQ